MKEEKQEPGTVCGLPIASSDIIRLAHGSGGKMTSSLIESLFVPLLGNEQLNKLDDATDFMLGSTRFAISTDSYVVSPIFFPGGNIGSLAVHGTVNDLCMRGAKPLFITASFILEEGLPLQMLAEITRSFSQACKDSNVKILAADTKVVGKGAADNIFINTTGFGQIDVEPAPSCQSAIPGDLIIVSGDIGRHGMAIMSARESLNLETEILSDSAPLHKIVQALMEDAMPIHCMRDITRGGLATVLNELAKSSNVGMYIYEHDIPVHPQVEAVCELLGLDPLYVACEGRFVSIVSAEAAESVVSRIRQIENGSNPSIIGEVRSEHSGAVIVETRIGGKRILDKLSGEQLPRIC